MEVKPQDEAVPYDRSAPGVRQCSRLQQGTIRFNHIWAHKRNYAQSILSQLDILSRVMSIYNNLIQEVSCKKFEYLFNRFLFYNFVNSAP